LSNDSIDILKKINLRGKAEEGRERRLLKLKALSNRKRRVASYVIK